MEESMLRLQKESDIPAKTGRIDVHLPFGEKRARDEHYKYKDCVRKMSSVQLEKRLCKGKSSQS